MRRSPRQSGPPPSIFDQFKRKQDVAIFVRPSITHPNKAPQNPSSRRYRESSTRQSCAPRCSRSQRSCPVVSLHPHHRLPTATLTKSVLPVNLHLFSCPSTVTCAPQRRDPRCTPRRPVSRASPDARAAPHRRNPPSHAMTSTRAFGLFLKSPPSPVRLADVSNRHDEDVPIAHRGPPSRPRVPRSRP